MRKRGIFYIFGVVLLLITISFVALLSLVLIYFPKSFRKRIREFEFLIFGWFKQYEHSFGYYKNIENNLQRKINEFPLLEIGCGSGDHIISFVKGGKKVVGLDLYLHPKMLEKTNKYKNLKFVKANAEKLPIKNRSIRTILAVFVLHHIPNYKKVLNEIYRVLKKDGRLVLVENYTDDLFKKIINYYFIEMNTINKWTIDEILDHVKEIGFRNVQFKIIPSKIVPSVVITASK